MAKDWAWRNEKGVQGRLRIERGRLVVEPEDDWYGGELSLEDSAELASVLSRKAGIQRVAGDERPGLPQPFTHEDAERDAKEHVGRLLAAHAETKRRGEGD